MLFNRRKRATGFAQRLLPLLCFLTFISASGSIRAQGQTGHAIVTATRATNLAVFDDVWTTIKDRYYDSSLHDVDWHDLRQKFRPLAAEATSTSELYATLRRMLAHLRDSHTRLYASDEIFDRKRTLRLEVSVTRKKEIAVVRLKAFTSSTAADFGRAFGRLATARGIVLDLRDNAGGESEAMLDVLSAFLPPNSLIGRFTDRNGRIATELQTRTAMLSAAARITPLPQPVVVLTSPKTASAAEIFVAALRERGRAQVLGENTCGCVLGTRGAHKLPDEGQLVFSEMDYRTILGTRLEGAGISPDETIQLSRRDLQAKSDPLLDRAVEILKAKVKR